MLIWDDFLIELQEEMISGSMIGWNSLWEIQQIEWSYFLNSRKGQGFAMLQPQANGPGDADTLT